MAYYGSQGSPNFFLKGQIVHILRFVVYVSLLQLIHSAFAALKKPYEIHIPVTTDAFQ